MGQQREERRRRLEFEKERLDNQRVRDAMREVKTFSHPVHTMRLLIPRFCTLPAIMC